MSLVRPASPWRRFAAAIYDGLLLIGIFAGAAWIDVLLRGQLGLPGGTGALQGLELLLGLAFFGWSWTHGGQTLGMRSWKLQVRRQDASPLRWPVASVRYVVMLFTWIAALLPALLLIPKLANHVQANTLMIAGLAYNSAALLLLILDPRHRAPCDLIAGTEVVVLPKNV